MTSCTLSTSWRGQCPNHLRHTWGRPSTYYATWPGPSISRSPTSKELSNSRPFSTRTEEETPTTGSLHHYAFQRPDQLQVGHSRINYTIYNGGGNGGGGAHHEESSLLQQHDAGARLQGRVQQRAALHRQHIGTSRRQQPHIQPSRKAHCAEVLLCAGISG